MAILRAYALPHPKLAVPAGTRGEDKTIPKTLAAFDAVAEEIAYLRPDNIIFLTPHNIVYDDYFHISPGNSAKGTCDRFGSKNVKLIANYDPNFAAVISHVSGKYGISAKTLGEKRAPLDHGVMVPLWHINRRYSQFKTIRISASKLDDKSHYKLGQVLGEAAANIGRRTVVIACGNLSRRPMERGKSTYVAEALEYDNEILNIFAAGAFNRLFSVPENIREGADECGHDVFTMLAGCLDRKQVRAEVLSYENPVGEGYVVASFTPGPQDERRNFLDKSHHTQKRIVMQSRSSEDAYCVLARRALEYAVLHNQGLPVPVGLPREMTTTRAGAFVSLYIDGRLRGAAGALGPTTDHIAAEIIKYSAAAGQADKRFPPITEDELSGLVYKVDIIGNPEPVTMPEELDVRRYGLIVTSGDSWGVMLPNQPNITTPEEQIAAVKQRAGIDSDAEVKLERFAVTRHE